MRNCCDVSLEMSSPTRTDPFGCAEFPPRGWLGRFVYYGRDALAQGVRQVRKPDFRPERKFTAKMSNPRTMSSSL